MADWQEKVNTLIAQVKAWRQKILQTPPERVTGWAFSRALSDELDSFVRAIYALAWERAMAKFGNRYLQGHSEVALLATGGYGRQELSPFSDIDIAFVPLEEDDPFVDALLRECFRLLVTVFMDNTDLKVGYGYRPLADLPSLDSQTQAALLDARFLAGYEPLAQQAQKVLTEQLDVLRFLRDRERERLAAYQRFHASPFVAEPHLKEGAGGLRDGQTALWLLAALHRIPTKGAWRRLKKLLPPDRFHAFRDAYDFLLRVRNWLHLTASRRQEVLLREYHHRIAFDFRDEGRATRDDEEGMVRAFHRRLFEAMSTLHHTLHFVRHFVADATIPLPDGFLCEKGRLTVGEMSPEPPERLLKAFELLQRYDLKPSAALLRWLSENADQAKRAQTSPEAAQSFLSVLTGDGDAPFGKALRLMEQTGVLSAYLPEWGEASVYVPSNAAHRFTVGEHLLSTVTELHRLREAAQRGEFPWVDVWAGVSDETVLFLAAFIHDLGKALSEPDHEEVGIHLARKIGGRLGLPEDRLALLEKLVRRHLILLSTARLRDVFAPETLRFVADEVGEEGLLKMLLLHSFADARSVSEQTFTEVEERMVLDLYFGVLRTLQERAGEESQLATLTRTRARELRRTLREVSDAEIQAFCEAMPPGYLLSTPLRTIAIHCRLVQQVRQRRMPAVEVLTEPDSGFTEVVVCALDDPQPGMLSKIAGALFACDADIRTARVFTLPGEPTLVLDTLWVTADGRPLSDGRARRVQEAILAVLTGAEPLEALLHRNGKPVIVPVQVRSITLRNDLSETHTVIHIVARDRKGLLYRLTREIAALGLDIQTAKIVTWRETAEDAFYVVRKGAGKVPDDLLDSLTRQLWERLG
jgi:[protein-PII] uridylyltransferase